MTDLRKLYNIVGMASQSTKEEMTYERELFRVRLTSDHKGITLSVVPKSAEDTGEGVQYSIPLDQIYQDLRKTRGRT